MIAMQQICRNIPNQINFLKLISIVRAMKKLDNIKSRGGVEDTRLEAKAKDTSASALKKKKKKVFTKIF